MSDIVERLRRWKPGDTISERMLEAAAEIERLRNELEMMKREKERFMWDERDKIVRKRLGIT